WVRGCGLWGSRCKGANSESPVVRREGQAMKIVIIGGTGLIGSKTAPILRKGGHEVIAASPNTGVNTITGEGLKQVLAGAQVVIDLSNSPSFEDKAVPPFPPPPPPPPPPPHAPPPPP